MQTSPDIPPDISSFRVIFSVVVLLALCVGGILLLRNSGYLQPEQIVAFLDSHRVSAPLLFVLLFIAMTVSFMPTLPLNIGAGLLWGPFWGGVLTVVGATAGACCAFLISRYAARDYCTRKFRNPGWMWLMQEIESKGWKAVAFVRVNPIFASGPLNFFFGITPIPLFTYLWSTALFLMPPAVLIATLGHMLGWEAQNVQREIWILAGASTITVVAIIILRRRKGRLF